MDQHSLFQEQRVYLSALDEGDARMIASWHNNPDYCRLHDANVVQPRTADEIRERIIEVRKIHDQLLFAFRRRGDDQLVGWGAMITYHGVTESPR